jgi:hypothetical protein
MSQHTYTVENMPNGDLRITRDDLFSVAWTDADFQSWNNAQQTPASLSNRQQFLQQLKNLTLAQLQSATQAQKDRLLFELLQKTLRDEIV